MNLFRTKPFIAIVAIVAPTFATASPLINMEFLISMGFNDPGELTERSSSDAVVEAAYHLSARRSDGAMIDATILGGISKDRAKSLQQVMSEMLGSAAVFKPSAEAVGFSGQNLAGQIHRQKANNHPGTPTSLLGLTDQELVYVNFYGPKKLTERGFLENLPANDAEEIVERVYRESSARLTGRRLSLVGVKTLGGRHVPAMKCSRTGVLYGDLKVWSVLQNMDTPTVKSPGLLHLKGPRGTADLILGSQEAVVKGKRQTFGAPVAWKDGKWWAPESALEFMAGLG